MSSFYALVREVYDPGGRSLAIEPRIRFHRLTEAQRAQLKDAPELITDGVKVHVAGANDPLLRDSLQAGAAAACHVLRTRGCIDAHVRLMNWTFPKPVQGESAGLLSVLAFVSLCVQPSCSVAATGKIAKQGDTWEGCKVDCIAGINKKLQVLIAHTAHITSTSIVYFFYPQGHDTGADGERLDDHLRACAKAAGIQLMPVETVAEAVTSFLQLGEGKSPAPPPAPPPTPNRKWLWGFLGVMCLLGAVWMGGHAREQWVMTRLVLWLSGGYPGSLFELATQRVIKSLSQRFSIHNVPSERSEETLRRLCNKESDLGVVVGPVKVLPDCQLLEITTVGEATLYSIDVNEASRQQQIHTASGLIKWLKVKARDDYRPALRIGGSYSETRRVIEALSWPKEILEAGELPGNNLEDQFKQLERLSCVVFILSHEPIDKYWKASYRLLPVDRQSWSPQTLPYTSTTIANPQSGKADVITVRVPLVLVASAAFGNASGRETIETIKCLLAQQHACPHPRVDRWVIYGLGCLVSTVLSVVALRSWWRTNQWC